MADKFQVLVDSNRKHAIIERTESGNGREYWNIYIPDAGDRNAASRVARLLNEEFERDQALRAQRNPSEV